MTAAEQLAYLQSKQAVKDGLAYLDQLMWLSKIIDGKAETLAALREQNARIRQALGQPPEENPEELRPILEELSADYRELLRLRQDIIKRIQAVPHPIQRAVLEMHYVGGMKFYQINMQLHYESNAIYHLRNEGARHVALQLLQAGVITHVSEQARA